MGLNREDFRAFFAHVHDGATPFTWQERLLDAVLEDGAWPEQVVAPTGAGKTAVVDIHVFAQALTADAESARRPPRRLSLVVGRRVLVDNQHEHAGRVAQLLAEPSSDLMSEISERLWLLHAGVRPTPSDTDAVGPVPSPLVVGRLRGGQAPSRAWRDYPTAAAVICATPDMWGSRLLFRGYATSWKARAREAGLLAFDSVVVVDEAHLAQQLLHTARRVRELVHVAEEPLTAPGLQVVETTATPARTGHVQSVGVEPGDLAADDILAARLTRPKPVTAVPVPGWDSTREPPRRKVAADMADAVQALLRAAVTPEAGRTVGCFVNTVHRAVDVAWTLRAAGLRVVMLCGQVRPHDLDELRARHPGVLDLRGCDDVDVLVATQTLEVGVDIDLAAAVTELASGSALAQRAGRVNRRGLRQRGPITVVVPEGEITEKVRSGPYAADELRDALAWVDDVAATDNGMAPWQLTTSPPPPPSRRRQLYQRLELADAWHWARTSDDVAADPELDLWLAEDLTADTSVSVVVRQAMPTDPLDAVRLLRLLPPQRHEQFGLPYRTARSVLRDWGLAGETPSLRTQDTETPDAKRPDAIVVRGDDVAALQWRPATDGAPGKIPSIRPGDVIVLDDRETLFTSSEAGVGEGFSPPVVVPVDEGGASLTRYPAADVLEARAAKPGWAQYEVGGVVLRLESAALSERLQSSFDALGRTLAEPLGGDDSDVAAWQRLQVADWLATSGLAARRPMAAAAQRLLHGDTRARRCELTLDWSGGVDSDEQALHLVRVLLRDRRRPSGDDQLVQVLSSSSAAVTLDRHQQAVADRAAGVAERVALPKLLAETLRQAGAHHDDGKADGRFQRRLGRRGDVVLAKGRPGVSAEQLRRNEERADLPRSWRHEQLSVVAHWDALHGAATAQDAPVDPLLAARLIGTSHGYGRSGFPHVSGTLLPAGASEEFQRAAHDLFDAGAWDDLIEHTQERYGVWGCAYLEALVRAADTQVSREGS